MRIERRVRLTRRKKLDRSRVRIMLSGSDEERTHDAQFDFAGLEVAKHCRVFVEAYCGATVKRFDYGTVDRIVIPGDRTLAGLDQKVGLPHFRVKVVDFSRGPGRIAASADRIRPMSDEWADGRLELLPVRTQDIGDTPWMVEFDDDGPILLVNSTVPNLKDRMVSDAFVRALVMPGVLSCILERLRNEVRDGVEETGDDWRWRWLMFTREFSDAVNPEDIPENWVNTVVSGFCERHEFKGALQYGAGTGEEDAWSE